MDPITKFRGELRSTAVALRGPVSPSGVISGVALHYDQVNANGWAVASGAIDLFGRLPVMLWSHDAGNVIGRWTSVSNAGNSLTVRGQLNLELAQAREVLAMLTAGDVSGLSVGVSVEPEDVQVKGDSWIFKKAALAEISVVSIPADSEARISTVASVKSIRDFERFLREAGFARQFAAKLASRGWPNERTAQSEITAAVERIKARAAAFQTIGQ